MAFWSQVRSSKEFPDDFAPQKTKISSAIAISDLPALEIASYFRDNPSSANALLLESCDKRYSPSTYIEETPNGYTVGWYSTKTRRSFERYFSDLADAATDYLLFSMGRGRWFPTEDQNQNRRF
jgi:hypothetical protein